jgi:hypothetical protein
LTEKRKTTTDVDKGRKGMNALSRRSFRNRLERAIGPVLVMVMLAATASSALAADLPGAAGNNQSMSPSYVTQCEAQLAQVTPYRQQAKPPYAGLVSLRSDTGRYDLWRPAGWIVNGVDSTAIVLTPGGYSQVTYLSIQVMDMPETKGIDDLQGRIEWFNKLINTLPGAQGEWQARWRSGNVSGFDARYTYQDYNNDASSERWVRVLFVGTKRYYLVAEAPAGAQFNSLEPMFLAMMVTFRPDDRVEDVTADMCVA